MQLRNSRRSFVGYLGLGAVGIGLSSKRAFSQTPPKNLHLACGEYPWMVFYRRDNRDFRANLDPGLGEIAAAGFDGFEPLVNAAAEVDRLAPLLKKHGLEMRSLYVNSVLHDTEKVNQSIEKVLEIANKAKALGTKLIVTNPSPIQWGGPQNKSDRELETQASALNRLGSELTRSGQILAYHNHDIELREAAREFHHMLVGTDPKLVTFCLDAHWIYRGAGDSEVALFDVLHLYGSRVTELHIRQSVKHTWSEAFGSGDVDYPRLVRKLVSLDRRPHLLMEQAIEQGSPHTMTAFEAHRKGLPWARRVFAALAG